MPASLRTLLSRLKAPPAALRLGWWLAAVNVLIVLVAVGGISLSATDMLRDLADEQGRARAELAGATAREDLRRIAEDTLTLARVLADRPTLQRLLGQEQPAAIAPFLQRFCRTGGVDACAILKDDQTLVQVGPALPWQQIAAAGREQGERFLVSFAGGGTPVLGAAAQLDDGSGARVFVVQLLDQELARTLARHVGHEVRLVDYRGFLDAPVDELTGLHSAALADGRSAVERVGALGQYVSSVPVYASTGEAVVLIETRLPAAAIDASVGRLIRRLLVTALIVGLLAVLAGILLGRRVSRPVQRLTEAAERLARGDFSTSIPPGGGTTEVATLGRTMEDMRRSLVELTGALRRREAEAHAVLGGIVEGVYAVDRERRIRYLNPQAAKLLGVPASEAVGRFCGDVLKPRGRDGRRPCEHGCPILQARVDGTALAIERLEAPDGTVRTAVITSSAMVDNLQVQVLRDETELEAVRRARDSVLANISHEFRTPLAAQLASIELLREGLATMPAEQQRELVLSLQRGTLRLTRLIDNLLESVRIESGQLGIRRQSVDLAEVIGDAEELIGSLLVLRRQTLEVSLPDELPRVSGDAQRLTQVLVNLVANASKFAPEGSTVRIGAAASPGTVTAWVEDEGPGIPEEEGDTIFERFRRGRDEEPEPGGLGLGLWIAKSIVDRHGGTITATRTAEARTRFSITLPAEEPS